MIEGMRRRLTAVLMLFLVGIYVGFCAVSYAASAGRMERERDMMLDRIDAPAPPDDTMHPVPGQVGVPYFTIWLDHSAAVTETEQGQFDLSEETLEKIAAQIMAREEDRGYLEEYRLRYTKSPDPRGWRLVLTDESAQEDMRRSQARSSIVIGLLLLPVFYLFSRGVSAFVVCPVRRAWEQQSRFVADASHELKTPLTVILSNTDMILEDCGDQDSDLRRRADYIREEAGRMRGLVTELLTLARNDAAPVRWESLMPIDLSALTETAVLTFEAVAYEKGSSLTSKTEDGLKVLGEDNQGMQLVSILLDNAVKYSLPGGAITVTLGTERGKYALLSVKNASEPLDGEQLSHLFDRFYRVDEARSLQPGYGLGLSVAHGIVSRWGGKIWAEHKDGVTVFYVRLPLYKGMK